MRCDGRPVRPGTGTTQVMSKASKPDKQNGTLFADSIRASSLKRLHRQAGQKTAPDQCQYVNLALAMREPSTEDIRVTHRRVSALGQTRTFGDVVELGEPQSRCEQQR